MKKFIVLVFWLSFSFNSYSQDNIKHSIKDEYNYAEMVERNWNFILGNDFGYHALNKFNNGYKNVDYYFIKKDKTKWEKVSIICSIPYNKSTYGEQIFFKGNNGIFYSLLIDYNKSSSNDKYSIIIYITSDGGSNWKNVENDIIPKTDIPEYSFEKSQIPINLSIYMK